MYALLQPVYWSALEEVMGIPAWKSLPCWSLVADGVQVTPPDAQRQLAARTSTTTVEISTNHVAMVPRPDEVLQLIRSTVEAVAGVT